LKKGHADLPKSGQKGLHMAVRIFCHDQTITYGTMLPSRRRPATIQRRKGKRQPYLLLSPLFREFPLEGFLFD
jgi:hypothetical protein